MILLENSILEENEKIFSVTPCLCGKKAILHLQKVKHGIN